MKAIKMTEEELNQAIKESEICSVILKELDNNKELKSLSESGKGALLMVLIDELLPTRVMKIRFCNFLKRVILENGVMGEE